MAIIVTESNGLTWLLSGIYASMDYRELRILWQEVMALIDQDTPTKVARDFNYILGSKNKRDSRPFVKDTASKEFGHFLQSNDLVDLRFVGSCFTWYNNRSRVARMWERIDKIFATPS